MIEGGWDSPLTGLETDPKESQCSFDSDVLKNFFSQYLSFGKELE